MGSGRVVPHLTPRPPGRQGASSPRQGLACGWEQRPAWQGRRVQSIGGGTLEQWTRRSDLSVDDGISDVLQKGNIVHTKKSEEYVLYKWAQGVERHMGIAYLQY